MVQLLKCLAFGCSLLVLPAAASAQTQENPISIADQEEFCASYINGGFPRLQQTAARFGYALEDAYAHVRCSNEDWDILKRRVLQTLGARDVRNFIQYFQNIGKKEQLTEILNSVVPGPLNPHGTLLDFVEFYNSRATLTPDERRNYDHMIIFIRRAGGLRESELAEATE